MKRSLLRTVALTLAIAFMLSVMTTTTVKKAEAAGWTANSWTVPVVDDWGKSLANNEARGYLYNSTGRAWADWALLAQGDVWVNDTGSYITFSNLRKTWNNTVYGSTLTYSLVIKLKIDGKLTPITIYNKTILTIVSRSALSVPPYYYDVFAYKDLGEMLTYGEDRYGPVTPLVDDMVDPLEVWLFYKAFKLVDLSGLPVTVSDVEVKYTSNWTSTGKTWGTWITTALTNGIKLGDYWEGVTNGTYDPPTNGLIPVQYPYWHYEADCKVGWVIVKLPFINRTSLVNNMTFLFKYHGTLVSNFTATSLVVNDATPSPAWPNIPPIITHVATIGRNGKANLLTATLQANQTEYVVCNVNWFIFPLLDQIGEPWPTRNAKITLYDKDVGSNYPWPGVISPDTVPYDEGGWEPAIVWLRFPMVNHTLKIVVTWFDNTVNVTYIPSDINWDGGFDIARRIPNGLRVDMVQVWIKVYTSTQVPAPLDPNWVDEVKIRIESRTAPYTTYIAKLSYWHGYIILPDAPFGWLGGAAWNDLGYEEWLSTGWLPSGNWSTIDFFIKYKGLEVVNTVTRYPVNGSLKLVCPPLPPDGDYGRTFILYAGVYDVGFKVMLGCTNKSSPAPEYTPLILTTPDNQRILVTTDGQGVITLRDVPAGIYKTFTILYKMLPVNCTHINLGTKWEKARPITVNASTKPLIQLLFPVYSLNLTIWNFEGTFKLINLNVSLYNTVDYSKFEINNDLLRRALDVEHKRSIVFPDGWAVLSPIHAEAPGDLEDLLDYLGDNPFSYTTIWYRTEYYLSGVDTDDPPDGIPDWPMEIGLMPAANYSCRVSVQNGTQNAVDTGFRPADYNATVYWSEDPYPASPTGKVGKVEVSARKATNQVVFYNLYTYIYDVPVETLDASGVSLTLADMSAVILAEPFDLELGSDLGLEPAYRLPRQLWYMQQWDVTDETSFNSYMVRFNTSNINTFHSVNATVAGFTDKDLGYVAKNYPHQSRYLIGGSILRPTKDNYTFNVYYQGVLVYNDSIPLTNPYLIGTPGTQSKTGTHKLLTSVYPYVFEATNDPLFGKTFGIENLKAEVFWAGLNTTWWPTVNLTYRTAAVEFALLNASKHYKGFNMTVVKRMWGNVTGMETNQTIVLVAEPPYYSSFVKIMKGNTTDWGEFRCLVPVWNYSVGTFPTFMLTDARNNTALHGNSTVGGPRNPWNKLTGINLNHTLPSPTRSIFGTPVFVNYTTIPGKTNNVDALDDPRLVGVAPGYPPWPNYKAINATGLINPKTVPGDQDEGWTEGVSLTMDVMGVRAYGTGVLVNNNQSHLIYGDFQGRSKDDPLLPNLIKTATKPYKEESEISVAPPKLAADFFAHISSETMANDLKVWVDDYAGNHLAFQRVEVIRANFTLTRDDEEIPVPPALWSKQYTPRVPPYGPVMIASTPASILWGMYDVIVRTTNLTDADVVGTDVVVDRIAKEVKDLELYGHQWLYKWLEGGAKDWESQELHLKWPAKLDVQIKAGDGSTPINACWVYLIYGTNWVPEGWHPGTSWELTNQDAGFRYVPPDPTEDPSYGLPSGLVDWGVWEIGQNVTAGLTDPVGFAASLKVGPNNAKGPLATGFDLSVLNLGFNVYKDVYTVKVYYRYNGEGKIYGPVEGSVVWDTFTDQPQHRYIYLGLPPPPTATGEEQSAAQHKIYAVRIWDLKLIIVDQSAGGNPVNDSLVVVDKLGAQRTKSDGSVAFSLAPAGVYSMTAKWKSKYNPEEVTIAKSTIPLQSTMDLIVPATVFDVELQLVSPSGKPISGATMSLASYTFDNPTDSNGKVFASQVPSKYTETGDVAYPVTATLLGVDISPGAVTITASRTYILTATNIATLTVQVVGAQGQGLSAAEVVIKQNDNAGPTVFSGVANEQGIVNVEVPYGTYFIHTDYKGFTQDQTTTVSTAAPTPQKVQNGVFLEIFGQAMAFSTFVLWIIVIMIVVLVLAIVVHEYHVWRRKRLPQLFGAPRVPGA